MIHAFRFDDKYYTYDVSTGLLLDIDAITHDVLLLYGSMPDHELIGSLNGKYSEHEIMDVLNEIDSLKKEQGLFEKIDYDAIHFINDGAIKAMCLHVSHDCDLRCRYCFAGTGAFGGGRGLMSLETGKAAIEFLIGHSGNRAVLEVDFFGGEPFLNLPVVKDIVEYARGREKEIGKQFKFTITTNGYTLSDVEYDFLNREMHNVVLSIDGRPETHNRMRPGALGQNTHEKIMDHALKFVKTRNDKDYYIRGTYTKHNLDFMEDVKYLADAGFEQISVEPVVTDPKRPYAIGEPDIGRIEAEYERLAKWYIERRKTGKWFNFFHFMIDLENGPCAAKRLIGCGAGNDYIAVTPDGDIYPCHQFAGEECMRLGNLREGIVNHDLRKMFANNTVADKEQCRDCWAQFWCGGGCSANAYYSNQSIAKPNSTECRLQKKRLECALAVYAAERQL